jgi:hypothetical protein
VLTPVENQASRAGATVLDFDRRQQIVLVRPTVTVPTTATRRIDWVVATMARSRVAHRHGFRLQSYRCEGTRTNCSRLWREGLSRAWAFRRPLTADREEIIRCMTVSEPQGGLKHPVPVRSRLKRTKWGTSSTGRACVISSFFSTAQPETSSRRPGDPGRP